MLRGVVLIGHVSLSSFLTSLRDCDVPAGPGPRLARGMMPAPPRPFHLRKDRENVRPLRARGAVEIALPDVEEMRALVADGREKGFLTYDEIVGALQDAEVTKDQIEDFYSHLLEVGRRGARRRRRGRSTKGAATQTERPPELDLTVEPSLDSLRLYLREIGKVPLLTAERGGRARQAHRARRHGRQGRR